MIVAVTGASGFIGSHLAVELAARGHVVRALTRRASRHDGPGDWVRVDYNDEAALANALEDAEIVFHAAGATRAPSRQALHGANVALTQRVVDAVKRQRADSARRFVFVSSLAAGGPAASRQAPVRECDLAKPIEAYGETKLAAERLLANETRAELTWTVIRAAAVYGPRDRDFLQLFRLAHRGVALHPANREHWISIIHVRDLVDGLIAAATTPTAAGRTFYFANDEPVQWRELFRLGAAAAGKQLAIDVELPHALVTLGAHAGDVFARATGTTTLLATEKLALSRPRFWVCSTDCGTRELGFRATTPLASGFAETYAWYAEHGWL